LLARSARSRHPKGLDCAVRAPADT
jgi:hypothetical protein